MDENETKENTAMEVMTIDNFIMDDELKIQREKIKKRRSSFGKYLKENPTNISSQDSDAGAIKYAKIESATKSNKDDKEFVTSSEKDTSENNTNLKSAEDISPEDLHLIELYQERIKQLEKERQTWNKLHKERKRRVNSLKVTLAEAENGDNVIGEDEVLPELSREHKAIMHSRPDYQEYIQECKLFDQRSALMNLKIENVLVMCRNYNELADISSKALYETIERKFLGDLREKDPVLLLKEYIDVAKDDPVGTFLRRVNT